MSEIALHGQHLNGLLSFGFSSQLPVILQNEAAECGLTCLAMIASYHGYRVDLSTLRSHYPVSSQGTNLKQLMDIASKLNLTGRPLKLEIEHLPQLQVPCVLHWQMNHFVVLKKATKNKIIIHDPAFGERTYSTEETGDKFTGIALELTPTTSFKAQDHTRKLRLSHFWSHAKGLKRSLGLVLLLSLFLQLFAIVNPYYMQTVVDDVLLRQDHDLLTVLAFGFVLLLVIEVATSLLRQYVVLNLSSKLNMQMSANVFSHLMRLPLDYFSKRHMGDVMSRFGSLSSVRELLTTGVVAAILDGVMACITLLVMFWYNVTLTLLVVLVVGIYAFLRFLLYRPIRNLKENHIVAAAKEQTHFMESIRAIQTIKMLEKEASRQGQWQNKLADVMNKQIRISHWQFGFDSANKLLFGLENILIIFFAATAVLDNLMTVGMLYAYISYKTRYVSAMDNLINTWFEFRMLELHFSRLSDIVFSEQNTRPEKLSLAGLTRSGARQKLKGAICLEDLAFRYSPHEQFVFDKINLRIHAGETLAIVGASGSGKSTLLKCMMGLYIPIQGNVLIDNTPLASFPDLKRQVAAVMQDDQLLSGSIADNIACFDAEVSLERVFKAAKLANIHQEICQMNMQYNTLVGDMGASLSGGQKQRILLARAFYRQPKILFMDEATSHLDTDNESKINQSIKTMKMTRVIVAHRPETIRAADRVLRLANGRLEDITRCYS